MGPAAKADPRRLLVLGASNDQLFLIRTAQQMGLQVVAVDQNPDAPGLELADEAAVVSTHDVSALAGFLQRYQQSRGSISGVITMGSDIPHVVARLSAMLGTAGVSEESARLATDKLAMKRRFCQRNIPVPWFEELDSVDQLRKIISQRGYPLVLKPNDRSGSRGVYLLQDGCDPESLFQRSREVSYSHRILVEEYLGGPQISTETIMYEGQGVTPGFADRNYEMLEKYSPRIIENGAWVPTRLSQQEREEIEDLVVRASLALGITEGVTKGDIVKTKEGPRVIEMAARLSGGDFCESLVPLGTGVNYVKAAIQIALGDPVDLAALKPQFQRAVANRYFFPRPGRLLDIKGAEEVREKSWIRKLEFWYRPGEWVPSPSSHAQRFGVFVVVAPTLKELDERVKWVYQTICVSTSSEHESEL